MRSLGWVLIQYDGCPYKKVKSGHTEICTRGRYVKAEAEIGAAGLQVKERQEHQKTGVMHGTDTPSQPRRNHPADTLASDIWPPEL